MPFWLVSLVVKAIPATVVSPRKSSYFRQFKKWGDASKKHSTYLHDKALITLVTNLYRENIKYKEILRALREFEGYLDIKS